MRVLEKNKGNRESMGRLQLPEDLKEARDQALQLSFIKRRHL